MLSALARLFGPAPRGAPMRRVPGGLVRVDSAKGKHRWHLVFAFDLDERPVSNREFLDYLTDRRLERPPWMFRAGFGDPEQPVVGVTFAEARGYAAWAGKRLPSDAEWLRAAGVHQPGPFPWGHAPADAARAVFGRGERGAPSAPSDTRIAGRGPYGHQDLLGNVWEWCNSGVCRGGFWGSRQLETALLLEADPQQRSAGVGLRCAR